MTAEMDIEAIQAQIDLSNSIAYDLVSSWMKPTPSSSKNDAESVSKVIARELEEHAKRPPRLGLGAAVSKSSVATSREAARLRGKLTGTKRTRDEGGDGASTSGTGKGQGDRDAEDEDEDESRSAAISVKKVKVNGVRLGIGKKDKAKGRAVQAMGPNGAGNALVITEDDDGRKKKKRTKKHQEDEAKSNAQDVTTSDANSTPSKPNPFVLLDTPRADQSAINLVSPSPVRPAASAESPTSSKKKKKHKKKKDRGDEDDDAPLEAEEWTGFSNFSELIDSADITDESTTQPHKATPMPSRRPPNILEPPPSSPYSVIDVASPSQPSPSPLRRSHPCHHSPTQPRPSPSPSRHPQVTGLPLLLLNLSAAPLGNDEEEHEDQAGMGNSSPKKKRPKRRRGKGGRAVERKAGKLGSS